MSHYGPLSQAFNLSVDYVAEPGSAVACPGFILILC